MESWFKDSGFVELGQKRRSRVRGETVTLAWFGSQVHCEVTRLAQSEELPELKEDPKERLFLAAVVQAREGILWNFKCNYKRIKVSRSLVNKRLPNFCGIRRIKDFRRYGLGNTTI